MLAQYVTGKTTRIFKAANNLQPVRKILKRLYESSLLNLFWTCLSPYLLLKKLG